MHVVTSVSDDFWPHAVLLVLGSVCGLASSIFVFQYSRHVSKRDDAEKDIKKHKELVDHRLDTHERRIGDHDQRIKTLEGVRPLPENGKSKAHRAAAGEDGNG